MNISAIWLRRIGGTQSGRVQVLAQYDGSGRWRLLVEEAIEGAFSHIVEDISRDPKKRFPIDTVTS